MASVDVDNDASDEVTESPRKRQRRSPYPPTTTAMDTTALSFEPDKGRESLDQFKVMQKVDTGSQYEREVEVGILYFVNEENLGFQGVLKQRYTDFLVNEIMPDGQVAHLTDDRAPNFNATAKTQDHAPYPSVATLELAETGGLEDSNTPRSQSNITTPGDDSLLLDKLKHSQATSGQKPEENISINGADQRVKAEEVAQDTTYPSFVVSHDDKEKLISYFGTHFTEEIINFHGKVLARPEAKASTFGSLVSEPIKNREIRGRLHQDIRRIFLSRLETVSTNDSSIQVSAAATKSGNRGGAPNIHRHNERGIAKGKLGWKELGGEYLHFSLYKENKDTIEVINFISRQLRVKPKDFSFAGTKDRRAVTVQRVSVFRQHAKDLAKLNHMLHGSRVGDFTYEKHGLQLGELRGNQFHITLRDCHFGNDSGLDDATRLKFAGNVVGRAVEHLQSHGFINYFGLQRFGTFGIGTDEIGKRILQGDFERAVDAILNFSDNSLAAALNPEQRALSDKIGRDDVDRAHAIHLFKNTGKGKDALEKMPRKFSGESAIIRHLSSGNNRNDYPGALMSVTRNLRTMYVHAYQSLVWNIVASRRWSKYGSKVIAGDLVLVENAGKAADVARTDEYDENGEIIIRPAADDVAVTHDDLYERARPVSSQEAESGKFSIFDVVLPMPGFDIEYPSNDIGNYYMEFMGSERGGGLDPANMRRSQKDFSLSGSYRKFLAQVGKGISFEIKAYHQEVEQLVETDLEKLDKSRGRERNELSDPSRSNGIHRGRGGYEARGSFKGNNSGRGGGFARGRRDRPANNRGRGSRTREWPEPEPTGPQKQQELQQEANSEVERQQNLDSKKQTAINAWANLPAKLASDDEFEFEAFANAKRNNPAFNPHDAKQPVFEETFIQTSAENEGRRTGYRSTELLSNDRERDEPEVLHLRGGAGDPEELDAGLQSAEQVVDLSYDSSVDSHDGGAQLSLESSPLKRSYNIISTETATEQPPAKSQNDLVTTVVAMDNTTTGEPQDKPAKLAVIVKFNLGSSQYATMALRELMKAGGVKTYKPDFSGGR